MAALGWLMNLDFAGGTAVTAVFGPYYIEAGRIYHPGAVIGDLFVTGIVAGQPFHTGSQAGKIRS